MSHKPFFPVVKRRFIDQDQHTIKETCRSVLDTDGEPVVGKILPKLQQVFKFMKTISL